MLQDDADSESVCVSVFCLGCWEQLRVRVLCPTSLLCAQCSAVLLLSPLVLQSMEQLSF
jgi:hypothetical protein